MFSNKTKATLVRLAALLIFSFLALASAPTLHAGNIAMLLPATAPLAAPPPKATTRITLSNYQGNIVSQEPEPVWVNHRVTGYAPGDSVPFRFNVESNGAASGQFQVRFTGQTQKCLAFDNYFIFNAIGYISGSFPSVTLAGNPTQVDFAVPEHFGTPFAEWVVTFNISFAGAGQSTIYHFLKLSDQAGTCNGLPPDTRLNPSAGDIRTKGFDWLFVPVVRQPPVTQGK